MKNPTLPATLVMAALLATAAGASLAAKDVALQGTYVEARTSEVFAGGCIMNSEAGTYGREAILAWKVDRGQFNGVTLDGLAVVAAVAGDSNLSVAEIGGEPAVTRTALIIDARATEAQRTALAAMARKLSRGLIDTVVAQTAAPIAFVSGANDIQVSSDSLKLTVEKVMTHDPTCGGKQWFHPFSAVDSASMGTTAENAFSGSALGTRWSDPNKHSSFFGTFSY
jgi:hypothetical protein